MLWPTDPAEQFFGRGLWGWATDLWERIKSDGSGALHVHLKSQDGTVLVQQIMPTLLKPGIHGYDGAAWQKLSLLWGYTDRYADQESDLSADVGTNVLSLTAVPEGEVWRVASIAAFNGTSNITTVTISLVMGAVTHYLASVPITAAGQLVLWTGDVTLKEGDEIAATFYGCVALDDLYMSACGYKMAVE